MQDQRSRNTGIVALAVPEATRRKTVAVAGTGGVGGLTASNLVRQVQLGGVNLAELDTFDVSNLNRQHGSTHSTLGVAKLKVLEEELRDIDPSLVVRAFDHGVTLENIDAFLSTPDGTPVDLLLNAIDYQKPEIFMALTRRATELGIPIIVGAEVAYGARVIWFKPGGMTYEQYFRVKEGEPLDLKRLILRVPVLGDIKALRAVLSGEIPEAPAIAVGGLATAAVLVTWIEAILSGVAVPRPAPLGCLVDIRSRSARYVRYSKLQFAMSGLKVMIRCALGLNPRAY